MKSALKFNFTTILKEKIMDKRNTFRILFFIKKHRINTKGEVPVYIRITSQGTQTELSLNRIINLKQWGNNCAVGSSAKCREINNYLTSTQSTIYEHYKYLRETGKDFSAKSIKNAYLGVEEDKGKKILELYEEHNERIKKLKNIDFAPYTIQRYEVSLRHTRNFIKRHYKRDDLYLEELNHDFLIHYETYFKTVRKCSHNTTLKYIKNFKKIVRIAMSNGDIKKDPFANFKMRLKKVDRGFLSEDELNNLINKKFNTLRLEQIRDCFVFSCFTGLAYSDLKRLSSENIIKGTDGNTWVKIKRKKTDNISTIPLLSVSKQILNKYKDDEYCINNNVLLPVISNQKMNAYLKEIGDVCGIKKNFSSHLARHTFATTVTLNNDVPIESVSKMLGHSSISMTKIYARLLDKKVGQDMKHLNDKYSLAID